MRTYSKSLAQYSRAEIEMLYSFRTSTLSHPNHTPPSSLIAKLGAKRRSQGLLS
ncbi:hypothetical protein COCSADRAFT_33487 [Bipolaris sorokiniana ND90Pr]|uniref:Uncharacterized protein n=1 Tax=Cochliobolus sativus (strain ND90Pr / ATCC 201652) TaxID=665912 RepID=M2RPW6_COCSN|nr:uncharacterized protein COCSADRAFT_33487 [Bipolaris sorokiniana ND90Pr]EMD68604.1 hypothetical protein COCSADRAFT_33487 [Bipolaris sorokiniana ND90Pr]